MNSYNTSPQIKIITCGYHYLTNWSKAIAVRGHWRMWWNRDPGAALVHNRKKFCLTPDHVVIVPPNTSIRHILEKPVHSLSFHFNLGQPYDSFSGKVLSHRLSGEFVTCINDIYDALKKYPAEIRSSHIRCHFQIYSLIMHALTDIPDSDWPKIPQNQYVYNALLIMENNIRKPLPNSTIAKDIGLTPNSFIKIFTKYLGTAPQTYLRLRRLEIASIELVHTAKSIDTIAEECGFCDRYYFSRQFKKRYGIGPATYRKTGFYTSS